VGFRGILGKIMDVTPIVTEHT